MVIFLIINYIYLSNLLREFVASGDLNGIETSWNIFEICFTGLISFSNESLDFDGTISISLFLKLTKAIIIIAEEAKATALFNHSLDLVRVTHTLARTKCSHRFLPRLCREWTHSICYRFFVCS